MKRRVLISAVVVIGLLLVTFTFLMNSPRFWERIVLHIGQAHADIKIKEVMIDGLRWNPQGSLEIDTLRFKLKLKKDTYFFSTGRVTVDGLYSLWFGPALLPIHMEHAAVVSDGVNMSDVSFQGVADVRKRQMTGKMRATSLEANHYVLTGVDADLEMNSQGIKLAGPAHFYGGRLSGDVRVSYQQPLAYDLNIDVQDVDLNQMVSANPAIFDTMKGIIQGHIQISGQGDRVVACQGLLSAPAGGLLKAYVLTYLAQYIPQKKQLEALILNNEDVAFDHAQAEMTSLNDEQFSMQLTMDSSTLNLGLKVIADVHIDGGIKNLLEYLK